MRYVSVHHQISAYPGESVSIPLKTFDELGRPSAAAVRLSNVSLCMCVCVLMNICTSAHTGRVRCDIQSFSHHIRSDKQFRHHNQTCTSWGDCYFTSWQTHCDCRDSTEWGTLRKTKVYAQLVYNKWMVTVQVLCMYWGGLHAVILFWCMNPLYFVWSHCLFPGGEEGYPLPSHNHLPTWIYHFFFLYTRISHLYVWYQQYRYYWL